MILGIECHKHSLLCIPCLPSIATGYCLPCPHGVVFALQPPIAWHILLFLVLYLMGLYERSIGYLVKPFLLIGSSFSPSCTKLVRCFLAFFHRPMMIARTRPDFHPLLLPLLMRRKGPCLYYRQADQGRSNFHALSLCFHWNHSHLSLGALAKHSRCRRAVYESVYPLGTL